jgi:hypothetical protein
MYGRLSLLLFACAAGAQFDEGGTCSSPAMPDQLQLRSKGCGWNVRGAVATAGDGAELSEFIDDCTSLLPSDLLFTRAAATVGEGPYLSTYQRRFAAFGDVFEMRDCRGETFAFAKQDFWTWGGQQGVAYDIFTPNGTKVLESRSGSFWDRHFVFTDTNGAPVGEALMTWSERMASGWFCNGGRFDVTFNASTGARTREVIVALAAIKAVRDQTRDSEGNVAGSWCHSFHMAATVGGPCLLAFLCCGACCGALRRRQIRKIRETRQRLDDHDGVSLEREAGRRPGGEVSTIAAVPLGSEGERGAVVQGEAVPVVVGAAVV